jgi:hypothetical protein
VEVNKNIGGGGQKNIEFFALKFFAMLAYSLFIQMYDICRYSPTKNIISYFTVILTK